MNRSKPLRSATGLVTRTPLKATAGLKRRTPMGRGNVSGAKPVAPRARPGFMTAAVSLVLSGEATVAQAARDCEVDAGRLYDRAWSEVKLIVRNRDLWSCAWCGELAGDVHHRQRRGSGGSSDPNVSHSPANLICLCRRDHDRAHAKDEDMHDRGLWLTTDQDPLLVPVYVVTEYGAERLWLLPDGTTTRIDQRKAAA